MGDYFVNTLSIMVLLVCVWAVIKRIAPIIENWLQKRAEK